MSSEFLEGYRAVLQAEIKKYNTATRIKLRLIDDDDKIAYGEFEVEELTKFLEEVKNGCDKR